MPWGLNGPLGSAYCHVASQKPTLGYYSLAGASGCSIGTQEQQHRLVVVCGVLGGLV